jgi:chemotaxis protein histidine kinase CheA
MSQAKLREALAGGAPTKEKGPPVADGVISETPDTPEAIEWRTKQSVIDTIASSSTYLDQEIESSPPSSVYAKFTWHIENFSDISKRELRSGAFQVGPYRWYVLVYPQGCDVSNHLSLFLCVADYDKLLPGWGHYAQFTIAVVNKDPKKSKYSDTLHRFCKKEHDWGWKKFMELNKISDGFTINNTLVIKAQVQVIPDRPVRPFSTLESQYRRELVRVYLTNVEGIVRRYVDEKRAVLSRVLSGEGFIQFWEEQSDERRKTLASAPAVPLLKNLVKKFFNEKEVTSTLVMDALYCGAKLLERAGSHFALASSNNIINNSKATSSSSSTTTAAPATDADAGEDTPDSKEAKDAKEIAADAVTIASTTDPSSLLPGLVINASTDRMFFAGDLIAALRRMVSDSVPTFNPDTKPTSDALALRNAQDVDDQSKGSVERDERRLADLGRRTVEMFGAVHIVEAQLEAAWVEAETIKRQEELIREVEEASRGQAERAAAKAETEKEKKARKKERQRAKKEAEKAKKEAEEAERQRQEEDRKAQAEKQRQEAEEKRRKEEAEKAENEARMRHAAELKKQGDLAAKAAAKAAKEAAKKAAATAAKEQQASPSTTTSAASAPAPPAAAAAAVTSRAGSHSSSSSNGSSPSSSATEEGILPDISCTPAIRNPVAISKSSNGAAGAGGNVFITNTASAAGRTPDLSSAPPRAASASATIPTQGPVGADNDPHHITSATHGLVDALRAEIHRLTLIVNGKDEEITGLRNRITELESHFITSRPGSSLSQQAQASPEASPSAAGAGATVVAAANKNNHTKHIVYSGISNATTNTSNGNSGTNPSDAILATASMMPPPPQVPPSGLVSRSSAANSRPLSANAQFAPVPPNGSGGGGGGTLGSFNKIRANGNGAPNGSGHSSSEGIPPSAGMLPPNGGRMYQQPSSTQTPARGARAFSSPLPNTKRGVNEGVNSGLAPGLESPGLDDFAHIGLINDLLE